VDVSNESESSPSGCSSVSTNDSPDSCSACPPLAQSLLRQSKAMERLAELLVPLIAQNQILIDLLNAKEGGEDSTYLDGRPR